MSFCCSSGKQTETKDVYSQTGAKPPVEESRKIDNALEAAKKADKRKVKMLLLGAAESGKSTIFKQMRILYGAERDDDEIRMYGVVVRSNIIVAIRKLILHLQSLGLEDELNRESEECGEIAIQNGGDHAGITYRQAYDDLLTHVVEGWATDAQDENTILEGDWVGNSPMAGIAANAEAKLFVQYHKSMQILWKSKTMKQVWAKRAAMNVIDSHIDYLNDIPRIASPSYKPTTHDILITRVRTTHVVKEKYRIDGKVFEVYDVGGQRSERKKWFPYFDHVRAVIFVASLSDYDQTLVEAKRTNRMIESLELFRSVCNNRSFVDSSIILFLNKRDIFAEKIMYSDIAAQPSFSDYDGPKRDFDRGVAYFIQKFKNCLIDDEFNDSFIHVTCATDTNNMQFVLDVTQSIILSGNLEESGFLPK